MFKLFKKKPEPEPKPVEVTDLEVTFYFTDGTTTTTVAKHRFVNVGITQVECTAERVLENSIKYWRENDWYLLGGRLYKYEELVKGTVVGKKRTIMI